MDKVKTRIGKLETIAITIVLEMEGRLVLVEKLDMLDDTIVRTESKLDERKGFQCT